MIGILTLAVSAVAALVHGNCAGHLAGCLCPRAGDDMEGSRRNVLAHGGIVHITAEFGIACPGDLEILHQQAEEHEQCGKEFTAWLGLLKRSQIVE